MPKKPLTPFFRFFVHKRVKYAKKRPNLSVTSLAKELSKKYGSLSEAKKVFQTTIYFMYTFEQVWKQ